VARGEVLATTGGATVVAGKIMPGQSALLGPAQRHAAAGRALAMLALRPLSAALGADVDG